MTILSRIEGPKDLRSLHHEELSRLAQECRDVIVETITKRGGHLASNLGVVELTLALHRAFESPKDKLVFDTSNQCYTHKLVTGRRDRFASIRTPGGLSGFAEPSESDHDTLAAGHAGTGLSYGLGMSIASQDDPARPYTVVVVGDGALTCGTSYEALNNIVHVRPKRLIVVLNDNGWSISENVGWLSHWRNRFELHPTYQKFIAAGHKFFRRLPKGEEAWGLAKKVKASVEGLFFPNLVWDELGYHYVGPIDGHDYKELEEAFERAREVSTDGTPVVIHALTHKGRGFTHAEDDPTRFHQPGTPSAGAGGSTTYTYSQVFAKTLMTMMARDPKIVGISAAMLEGTALVEVKNAFPNRVFDVGIAEEHAIIMAGGMAKAGLKPVVSIYSTFLQRSYDQLIHDVCLQNLPVVVCVDRAGFVGDDGKTHQGIYDVAFTRGIPNMTVAAPKDENELQHLLYTAVRSGRPFTIRYPRGLGLGLTLDEEHREIPIGRGEILTTGKSVNLLAYGAMVPVAVQAAEALKGQGIDCGVAHARFAKPLDVELIGTLLAASPRLVTLEEHLVQAGFGSAVLEAVHAHGLPSAGVRIHGVPDQFIEHSPMNLQRARFKVDAAGVVETVRQLYPELGRPPASPESLKSADGRESPAETIHWA
jgi:1-deoxy-D-xylulose-5-phosphate synthase